MDLMELRKQLDALDRELTELFVRRMKISGEVAAAKKGTGKAVRDPAREREILNRLTAQAGTEFEPYVRDLYRHIFELSRERQFDLLNQTTDATLEMEKACRSSEPLPRRAVVACQGTEGAYAQQACEKLFAYPDILYFDRFEGVFSAVEQGMCEFGMVPVENSTAGSVTQVYELMQQHRFHIAGAKRLRVELCLMRRKGAVGPIREVLSHEQALRQCGGYFARHPELTAVPAENTAVAARRVAQSGRDDLAAIASRACAELYGLEVLDDSIADEQSNYTRFLCICRDLRIAPRARKVSVLLTLPHEPGALEGVLRKIALRGANLTKLESRPIPGREFEFRFFLDFEADPRDTEIQKMIGELERGSERFALLGAYEEF